MPDNKNLALDIENYFRSRYKEWEGEEQFIGTSIRLKRMIKERCWTPDRINKEVTKHFKATFKNKYDEMLTLGPTEFWTLCPHHLLPVLLKCWIGYIPNGRVLGLSKFSRIALTMARRPIMQEQYVLELADAFEEQLKPKGCGVSVEGIHGCMFCRGVEKTVPVRTTQLRGIFKTDPSSKSEFLSIVNK